MSAKFLHTLTDDPQLEKQFEKQIGCMTGILQLFDRHQILTGKRLYGQKKLPAVRSSSGRGSPGPDESNGSVQNVANEDRNRPSAESSCYSNARAGSKEASRAAYNDSPRQSGSLPESAPSEKLEAAARASWEYKEGRKLRNPPGFSLDNRADASILSKEPPRSSLDSRQKGRLSFDIRDAVRDSFYRDAPRLSVETRIAERAPSKEEPGNIIRPKDSPRPSIDKSKQQQSISGSPKLTQKPKPNIQAAPSDIDGKSSTPLALNESLRVLAKLKEAPWNFADDRDSPRPSFESKDGPRFSFSKDAPRFSYDGREIQRSSLFDFKDACRSSSKLREPPRLSLDSRESSRNNLDLRRNASARNVPRNKFEHSNSNGDLPEMQQLASEKRRSPNVVARLMGLEEMPGSTPTSQKRAALNQSSSDSDNSHINMPREARISLQCKVAESTKQQPEREKISYGLSKNDHVQPRFNADRSNVVEETANRTLGSQKSIQGSNSSQLKHPDAIPKPIFTQRCPIEPAPWRQQDSWHACQRKASEAQNMFPDMPKKTGGSSQVLYSEIENRLKQLELDRCDNNLKTLKQILDAMQHKGFLESASNRHHQNDLDRTPRSRLLQEGKVLSRGREIQGNQTKTGSCDSAKAFEAPIVIMKPARFINKSSISSGVPMESFSNYHGKMGFSQPGTNARTKRTIGNNRTLKDQQSGTPISRESVNPCSNEIVSGKNRRERITTKSEENSFEVLQKGRHRSSSPSSPSSPSVSRPQPRIHQTSKEILNNVKNNSSSLTAKLQRKKPEAERKSRQSPSRQPTKKQGSETSENQSPESKIGIKGVCPLQVDEVTADQCPETPQAEEISLRSDSNISSISHMDIEITSTERCYVNKINEINADQYNCKFGNENHCPLESNSLEMSGPKAGHPRDQGSPQLKKSWDARTQSKKPGAKTRNEACREEETKSKGKQSEVDAILMKRCEELSLETAVSDVPEQPSPVSVLDAASFYKDDSSPSPVKKCFLIFKGDETRGHDGHMANKHCWNHLSYQSDDTMDDPIAINHKMLTKVHNLVRKLEDLKSMSTMDQLELKTSGCLQNEAPEFKYIMEILLSSGLLLENTQSMSMEFHPSGFPINPDLFHVLEQKRTTPSQMQKLGEFSTKRIDQEKLNRQLIFGSVNDILCRKLQPYLHFQPWIQSPHKISRKKPTAQQLLKEVWEEVQRLPCPPSEDICDTLSSILHKDLAESAEQWSDHRREIGDVVLDVERMIFKDLIDETIRDMGDKYCCRKSSSNLPATTCRQLIFN